MRAATLMGTLVLGIVGVAGCGSTTRSEADAMNTGGSGESGSSGESGGSGGSDGSGGSSSSGGSGGSGGTADLPDAWLVCADSTECIATFAGCCDHCTQATLDNSIAINRRSIGLNREGVCSRENACPACVATPNPNLHALCTEGRCELVDISLTPLVTCTESSECKLRATTCCPCDPSASWIAINTEAEADYADLVCTSESTCSDCAIDITDIDALCEDGRCVVRAFGP
ncbi:MAG TPA: hypothetical protein VI197_08660 [Polyangiaceae bacterium]